jgi:hypothetical protein
MKQPTSAIAEEVPFLGVQFWCAKRNGFCNPYPTPYVSEMFQATMKYLRKPLLTNDVIKIDIVLSGLPSLPATNVSEMFQVTKKVFANCCKSMH